MGFALHQLCAGCKPKSGSSLLHAVSGRRDAANDCELRVTGEVGPENPSKLRIAIVDVTGAFLLGKTQGMDDLRKREQTARKL